MFSQGNIVYIRLRHGWLSVRVHRQGRETGRCEGAADAALSQENNSLWKVAALGEDATQVAKQTGVTLFHAFSHPRVIIDEFDKTLPLLREYVRQANDCRNFWRPCPFVMQVMETLEGELTDIEQRALCELGLRAGARSVIVVEGTRELTPTELCQMRTPTELCTNQQI